MNTQSLLTVFVLHLIIMMGIFVYAHKKQKADWVDVAWSFSIALAAIIYFFWHDGQWLNKLVVCGMSFFWYLRLGSYLFKRIKNDVHEDSRYRAMRVRLLSRGAGKDGQSAVFNGFLLFFLLQGVLASIFALPVWALSQLHEWHPLLLIIGVVIALLALIGESVADKQLYEFKQDPSNKGKTMRYGLWQYSRHPNYFFEWLHWLSYPVIGLAAGLYWLWVFPLLMYLFLIYITGIPFSEQQALAKRSDYRAYQLSTPMFFPKLVTEDIKSHPKSS